jgi:DHA1 family tetracycline resistance protein-like MFS transporter
MPILFLIVFVDLVGFGVIIPLLPFYGEHFAATPAQVGFLMAAYSLTQFIAAPFWGRLSDRIGRKPVLVVSLIGAVGAYVWLGYAGSLWMLFVARLIGGAMAGNISTAFAYVADVTGPENRAKGMGLIGAAFGLGFIFGPAIGGILAGKDPLNADYTTPALTAAGLSALALVLTVVLLKETLSKESRARQSAMPPRIRWQKFRQTLAQPTVTLLLGISFLATMAFAGMETTFAMWSRRQFGWGPEQNGYLFAFVGLLCAAVQGGLIGRLARRLGEALLILNGAIALAIGMLMIPFSTSLPPLLIAMIVIAVGFSLLSPSLNSLISLQVDADLQGGTMGVTRSVTTLARILGPVWAGALFHFLGKEWPFIGGALMMTAVILLGLRSVKAIRAGSPTRSKTDADSEVP